MQEMEVLSPKRVAVSPRLLKGMDEKEVQEFTESYKRARKVLTRINDIAKRDAAAHLQNMESPKAFEIPNWELYIAFNAGYRQAMRIVQDLTRWEKV
jgi:hypothetical protein